MGLFRLILIALCFSSCFSANPEHNLSDNTLDLSISLMHETDTTITG